jgi:hypothetical protein
LRSLAPSPRSLRADAASGHGSAAVTTEVAMTAFNKHSPKADDEQVEKNARDRLAAHSKVKLTTP